MQNHIWVRLVADLPLHDRQGAPACLLNDPQLASIRQFVTALVHHRHTSLNSESKILPGGLRGTIG